MVNRNMFVGLDVHKETIDVSIAEGESYRACRRVRRLSRGRRG